MPFNSPGFFLLLALTFPVYYFRVRERWQHAVLFIASFAFYWFAGVRDLLILLATIAGNHALASLRPSRARVALAVTANLGVLAFFKYRWFIAGMFAPQNVGTLASAVIPLGISFYVFQLIAYQVELHRGTIQREESFARLLLYVLFFPHHQAGPIMRPGTFLPQFRGVKPRDPALVARGITWILYGLIQKVIADRIGEQVDVLFAHHPTDAATAWLQVLGFSAQIYGDFAGYSNMAVGLGLLFGYELDRNFNQPYLAVDPSAFWERWHITLSAWLRDYLYIPLGGNRRGKLRTYGNLMSTMILGGLWHGASWNFVVWGTLHGVLLCVFRWLRPARWSKALSWTVCQFGVVLCWVPFRAASFRDTIGIWRAMFGSGTSAGTAAQWSAVAAAVIAFFAVHHLEEAMLASSARRERARALWLRLPGLLRGGLAATVLLACLGLLREETTFIYFRF
jgi:alginate O-acetyltransferase complex protein AlgI